MGGDKDIKVDIRVIAATNKDLKKEISENKFREDLYHRIGVIIINVPPLRERKDDVPLLVDRFLYDIANEYGDKQKSITPEAIKMLQNMPWTGNIREIRNVIERLVIMCNTEITKDDISKYAML